MRFAGVLAFLAVVLIIPADAQDESLNQVDNFVKTEMERLKIPGVSLAVLKDGKPLILKGYGLANIEHIVPVKPETIFQSGSVGKQFTSMAVMLLVEDGKIVLDEKIGKYLNKTPKTWANVTVRHLLTHTGGFADYSNDFDFRKDYTEDDLLKIIKETPLAFEPGERWQYSNFGYVTLGIIIRKVSGQYFGDFLQERVFKPLGMTTARVISEADIIPNRAAGYIRVNGQVKNQNWVSPSLNSTADGALYLSALDLMKWDDAFSKGKLLNENSYREMWKPVKLNDGKEYPYGFGWSVKSVNGSRQIEHGGAWQGFKSFIAKYPDEKITIILFANLENMDPAKMAHGIAEIIEPKLKPKPIDDPEPKVTAEFKSLLEKLTAGTADRNEFSPQLQKLLFDEPDRLFEFVKKLGQIKTFVLTKRNVTGSIRTYTYHVEYDEMTLNLEIGRDLKGKIVLFGMEPI